MKRYRPVHFLGDKKSASVPVIWVILSGNSYKCYWPVYGLKKKLQNYVPPPLETDIKERAKWKLLDCVLLNNKEYNTYEEADAAISILSISFERGVRLDCESTRIDTAAADLVNEELGALGGRSLSTAQSSAAVIQMVNTITVDQVVDGRTHSSAAQPGIAMRPLPVYADEPGVAGIQDFRHTLAKHVAIDVLPLSYITTTVDRIEKSIGGPNFTQSLADETFIVQQSLVDKTHSITRRSSVNTDAVCSHRERRLGIVDGRQFTQPLADQTFTVTRQSSFNTITVSHAVGGRTLPHSTPWTLPGNVMRPLSVNANKSVQVNIPNRFDWMKLKIEEDVVYEQLQRELQHPEVYDDLLQKYLSIYANEDEAENFVESMINMTFKDCIIQKIAFRNFDKKLNVEKTPLLECWKNLYQRPDGPIYLTAPENSVALGKLHLRIRYDSHLFDLTVHLIEAHNLCSIEEDGFRDPYVRLQLEPEVDTRKRQTAKHRGEAHPYFDQNFKFPVSRDQLQGKELILQMLDYDRYLHNDIIGEVRIRIDELDLSKSVEIWGDLIRMKKPPEDRPELLISLTYLPQAEILTFNIMKAKNLNTHHEPWVRIYHIVNGKRVKKRKTASLKFDDVQNPLWNESYSLSMPQSIIQTTAFEINLVTSGGESNAISCGIGPEETGSGKQHWIDILHNPRKPIAMWHYLR